MKPRGKIGITLLLAQAAVLLLSGTAAGDFQADFASESLSGVMSRYTAERGLAEDNFAMGWYDLTTGEEWFFNGDAFMVAGSMYKLPLNMAYTDKLASGDLSADDFAGEYTVERAMELSIVYSDNDAADALQSALRLSPRDYRLLLAQYSGFDESELPEEYFTENCVSPRFMINTLVYLYDNSGLYGSLLDHMKSAHPGRFFRKSEGEYTIAHKYGYFEGELNDCGIVYAPRPFALVVFTHNVRNAESMLAELCALMTDYSLYLESLPEPEYTPGQASSVLPGSEADPAPEVKSEPKAELKAGAGTEPAESPEPVPPDAERVNSKPLWGLYAAVCAALLCVSCVRQLVIRKRRTAERGGRRH